MKPSTTLALVSLVSSLSLIPIFSSATGTAGGNTGVTAQNPEQRGLEIARKIRAARVGFKGEKAGMELVLVNTNGDQVTRRLASQIMEVTDDGDRSIVTFEWPADVRDTRLLTWTHRQNSDDQWLYMPSIKRVKRISSNTKSGSFMGSEFAYEDMGSQEVEKYSYKYLREEALGNRPTWVIERYPVDENSGYSKQIVWYDKQYMNPLRVEYFDRKGELLKTATFDNYNNFEQWWRAGRIRMENIQTGKASVMTWKDRRLGQAPDPQHFLREGLEE
ncbi:MAG: outer membrane lipoprotein-sorting protein [Candidatus Competibacteraceae bacterium]